MRRKGLENLTIRGHTVKRRAGKNQCVTYLKNLCEWATEWGQGPMLNSRTDSYICSRREVVDIYDLPHPELNNKLSSASSLQSSSAKAFL